MYVTSRDNSKEIKRLYKKYSDLPNDIIRQIIEFKLQQSNHVSIKEAISKIQSIRKEMTKINKALADYELLNEKYSERDFKTRNVLFVEKENGYCVTMDIGAVLNRVRCLQSANNEIMNDLRYQQAMRFIKLYTNTN